MRARRNVSVRFSGLLEREDAVDDRANSSRLDPVFELLDESPNEVSLLDDRSSAQRASGIPKFVSLDATDAGAGRALHVPTLDVFCPAIMAP